MEHSHNESLGFLFTDLSRVMRKRFDRRAREHGWTRAQWRVLSRLRYRQGINQSTLADMLEVEPITLARHIDRLEEKGWVERRADPNDRRAWLLYLDDSVQAMLDDMQEISDWNQEAAFAGFSAPDRARFIADLKRVKASLASAENNEEMSLEAAGKVPKRAAGGRHG
ncbi:MAG: MarR family transcriptional regulator [Rhodospirillaceae bacterium]|jgi:DNA-binding MarR family transcriptional regulator|nr:MarR family transcriptional regulator [Rhodospirillaceae bacterium]